MPAPTHVDTHVHSSVTVATLLTAPGVVVSGSDAMLVVSIAAGSYSQIGIAEVFLRDPSGNTIGGNDTFTRLDKLFGSGSPAYNVEVWYLLDPNVAGNGGTIRCNWSSTAFICLGASLWNGVDLTNPFGATATLRDNSASSISVVVPGVGADSLVQDVVVRRHWPGGAFLDFEDDEPDILWEGVIGTTVGVRGKGSREAPPGGGGDVTVSWNDVPGEEETRDWLICGFEIRGLSGGGAVSSTGVAQIEAGNRLVVPGVAQVEALNYTRNPLRTQIESLVPLAPTFPMPIEANLGVRVSPITPIEALNLPPAPTVPAPIEALLRVVPSSGDWLGTWHYRLQVTIDSSKIDADLTDFPVMLRIAADAGISDEDVTAFFDELAASTDGLKVAFTSDDGETELTAEVERFDPSLREAVYWVKLPTVLAVSDTTLFVYYDAAQADNVGQVGIPGSVVAEGVWDAGHLLVNHMGDGTGLVQQAADMLNSDAGTCSNASTPSTLRASGNPGWATDQWANYVALLDDGQWRRVVSNDNNTLTIAPDWTTTPTNANTFTVGMANKGLWQGVAEDAENWYALTSLSPDVAITYENSIYKIRKADGYIVAVNIEALAQPRVFSSGNVIDGVLMVAVRHFNAGDDSYSKIVEFALDSLLPNGAIHDCERSGYTAIEGLDKLGSDYWVIFGSTSNPGGNHMCAVAKFNASWVWQATYDLFEVTGINAFGGQDIWWIDATDFYTNIHEGGTGAEEAFEQYHWNGSGFDKVASYRQVLDEGANLCGQGFSLSGSDIHFAGRHSDRLVRAQLQISPAVTPDSSGNKHDGNKQSASNPVVSSDVNAGYAQAFSLDFLEMGKTSDLDLEPPFTIEFRFRADEFDASQDGGKNTLLYLQGGVYVQVRGDAGNVGAVAVYLRGSGTGKNAYKLTAAGVLTALQWHHLALTYTHADDPTDVRLFLDGVELASGAFPFDASGTIEPNSVNDYHAIGAERSSSDWRYFKGRISEARISTVRRTDAEIAAAASGLEDDLVTWAGDIESLGGAAIPIESHLAVSGTGAATIEALQRMASTGSIPIEWGPFSLLVSQTFNMPIEALARAYADGEMPIEALLAVSQTGVISIESLKSLASAGAISIEALQYVSFVLPSFPLESLLTVTASLDIPIEWVRAGITGPAIAVPIEALGAVESVGSIPFEFLRSGEVTTGVARYGKQVNVDGDRVANAAGLFVDYAIWTSNDFFPVTAYLWNETLNTKVDGSDAQTNTTVEQTVTRSAIFPVSRFAPGVNTYSCYYGGEPGAAFYRSSGFEIKGVLT